jgi:Ca2+-binding RTX toxin-like protein
VGGWGRAVAGSGNDLITAHGPAAISVGGGADTLTLYSDGTINQYGSSSSDTIDLGTGNDTIYEQGSATVWGAFSNDTFRAATIKGGEMIVTHSAGVTDAIAVSGSATLVGSTTTTEFVGGTGSTNMIGNSGSDTFVGGSGYDTMAGVGSNNVFEFLSSESGGQHVIQNFVSGDQLYIEGYSLSALQSSNDITTSGGNTYISIDGGKTTIELKGVTGLSSGDITTHKP